MEPFPTDVAAPRPQPHRSVTATTLAALAEAQGPAKYVPCQRGDKGEHGRVLRCLRPRQSRLPMAQTEEHHEPDRISGHRTPDKARSRHPQRLPEAPAQPRRPQNSPIPGSHLGPDRQPSARPALCPPESTREDLTFSAGACTAFVESLPNAQLDIRRPRAPAHVARRKYPSNNARRGPCFQRAPSRDSGSKALPLCRCVTPRPAGPPAVPPSAPHPPAAAGPPGSGWPGRAGPPRTPR